MENTILQQETKETHHTFCSRMIVIAEIILCILLLPTFIICAMMFISSLLHPNLPPSFMGYTPLVVESGSMSPFFLQNDLILIRNGKEDTIYEKGTVICFQSEDVYVTHRITKVDTNEDGKIFYITQGDANNTTDTQPVYPEQILGSYVTRLKGWGEFVLYIQTPTGMIYCILLPIFVLFSLSWILPKLVELFSKQKQKKVNTTIY